MHEYINELTEGHRKGTENFLKSLKFIDNGYMLGNFFKNLKDLGINYYIIKAFDYEEVNTKFSEFKAVYFLSDREIIEFNDQYLTLVKIDNFYILSLNI